MIAFECPGCNSKGFTGRLFILGETINCPNCHDLYIVGNRFHKRYLMGRRAYVGNVPLCVWTWFNFYGVPSTGGFEHSSYWDASEFVASTSNHNEALTWMRSRVPPSTEG